MNLDEVERLLDGGPEGVAEWNCRRAKGEHIPDLTEIDLWEKELTGINFSGLRLDGGWFWDAKLENANFRGAAMRRSKLSSIQARNACFVEADLRESKFGVFSIGLGHSSSRADVSGSDFTFARLENANLEETIVHDACFRNADLSNANLCYTDLNLAITTDAKLDGIIRFESSPTKAAIHFGQWLRGQMESREMSPAEFADQLGCGLSGYDISTFMEKKREGVAPHLAQRLANIFRIDVSDVPRHPRD